MPSAFRIHFAVYCYSRNYNDQQRRKGRKTPKCDTPKKKVHQKIPPTVSKTTSYASIFLVSFFFFSSASSLQVKKLSKMRYVVLDTQCISMLNIVFYRSCRKKNCQLFNFVVYKRSTASLITGASLLGCCSFWTLMGEIHQEGENEKILLTKKSITVWKNCSRPQRNDCQQLNAVNQQQNDIF